MQTAAGLELFCPMVILRLDYVESDQEFTRAHKAIDKDKLVAAQHHHK